MPGNNIYLCHLQYDGDSLFGGCTETVRCEPFYVRRFMCASARCLSPHSPARALCPTRTLCLLLLSARGLCKTQTVPKVERFKAALKLIAEIILTHRTELSRDRALRLK